MSDNIISIRQDGCYWRTIEDELRAHFKHQDSALVGLMLFALQAVANAAKDLDLQLVRK